MKFYVPKTEQIRMPNGATHVVVRGISEVPDDLANSQIANKHGIKPATEMTDDECDALQVPRVPETVVKAPDDQIRLSLKIDDKKTASAP